MGRDVETSYESCPVADCGGRDAARAAGATGDPFAVAVDAVDDEILIVVLAVGAAVLMLNAARAEAAGTA